MTTKPFYQVIECLTEHEVIPCEQVAVQQAIEAANRDADRQEDYSAVVVLRDLADRLPDPRCSLRRVS